MSQYCDNFNFSENNQDHFVFGPQSEDNYQFWQGLRGPYYTPSVGDDGYLYWTNNGQLPNPEPMKIVGQDGRGITLTGQCETVADLPEDPEQGEAWAVGEEEPFECYVWFDEWVDLGLLFPAGQDGVSPAVTITQTSTGHKVKITDKTHPAGQEFDVDNGTPGQDGVSPDVTITQTSTGHKVKITDKTHPAGQEFDVDNGTPGEPGQGVPAGGAAGQFLRKVSATDYDTEWYSPAAGDVSYDSSLTYAAGTVGEELSSQRNTLTQLEGSLEQEENSLFILNDHGDLALVDIPAGYYVYVKGHSIKPEGLYQNLSGAQIPQGTTLSNNITSVSSVFNTTVDKVNLLPMTNVNNSMNFTGWTDDIKRVKVDVMLSASGGIVNSIIINTDEFGVKTYGAFALSYFQTTTAYCIFSFNITTAGITKVGETVSGWTGAHLEVRVTGYKTY